MSLPDGLIALLIDFPFSGPQFPQMIMRGSRREANLFPRLCDSQAIADLCSNGPWVVLPLREVLQLSPAYPCSFPTLVSLQVLKHTKHITFPLPPRLWYLLCPPPSLQSSHFPLAGLWLISCPLLPQLMNFIFIEECQVYRKNEQKVQRVPIYPHNTQLPLLLAPCVRYICYILIEPMSIQYY